MMMIRRMMSSGGGNNLYSSTRLARGIQAGDRASLARAITLVESFRPQDRQESARLLSLLSSSKSTPSTASKPPSTFRIGLSGPPGVGKSTFIERLGMDLVSNGHRVAVLAVDPSSSLTGGSILGDKTRMPHLSHHDSSFVRPSPSRGSIGGVARNTSEAVQLCEYAGYDVVLVETVGVGQSETLVADIVDMFVVLVAAGGGDELQGIKKGIVELADLVIVNKADGDLLVPAQLTQLEYVSALKLLRPARDKAGWRCPVVKCSSLAGSDDIHRIVWTGCMLPYLELMRSTGLLQRVRRVQAKKWMWKLVGDQLLEMVMAKAHMQSIVSDIERDVMDGRLSPGTAADRLVSSFASSLL